MEKQQKIKIGTRGSPLAVYQAHEVRARLIEAHGDLSDQIDIEIISTAGDQIQDKALREFGGKGLFTKEIEEALLTGAIDIAVHSMKDVQTQLPEGLEIACVLKREDVRDGFISNKAQSLELLDHGAVVGTSSLRRHAQVKQVRPDIEVVTFRGTVETRLQKITEGIVDATFLAVAGLNRLGLTDKITAKMSPDIMLPAVAQGAIGVECRIENEGMKKLLLPLNDGDTQKCIAAERALLKVLDGSCRTPIAALAELQGGNLRLRGQIIAPDGTEVFSHELVGAADTAIEIGRACGENIRGQAGEEFMAMIGE